MFGFRKKEVVSPEEIFQRGIDCGLMDAFALVQQAKLARHEPWEEARTRISDLLVQCMRPELGDPLREQIKVLNSIRRKDSGEDNSPSGKEQ